MKLEGSKRILFLAMPADVYEAFGEESLVKAVFSQHKFKLILYEHNKKKINSKDKLEMHK